VEPAHHPPQPSVVDRARSLWQTRPVLATVSFYYGHRDPVSVTAG